MNNSKKVALVTGGARRLGKFICLGLAESGFDIAFTYNSSSSECVRQTTVEIEKFDARVVSVNCDVTRIEDIRKVFDLIRDEFGKLDVLINNAAIFRRTDFLEIDEIIFDEFIYTNLRSVLFFSQIFSELMASGKDGPARIINISSMGAFENWTGYIPYSISKAGVVKLTELLAKKLAPDILVNSIAPGTIIVEDDENANVDPADMKKYPVQRFGKTNDIVSLVKYLSINNEFITGQTLKVDGGKSLS